MSHNLLRMENRPFVDCVSLASLLYNPFAVFKARKVESVEIV